MTINISRQYLIGIMVALTVAIVTAGTSTVWSHGNRISRCEERSTSSDKALQRVEIQLDRIEALLLNHLIEHTVMK